MSAIVTEQLTKRYGSRVGIEELTLCVPQGEVYGFLGPNGSGKTTTMRSLMGFLKPTNGRSQIFGRDCWRESRHIKEEVGYLPGDLRLPTWMTGHGAVSITSKGRSRDLTFKGAELAEYLGLDMTVRVRRMSRGMRQKLGLILALMHDPQLLILDEPTAGLDPLTQERLYQYLLQLANKGHTVFFSSHVLSEVEGLCHRVAIVRRGRLVADETLADLKKKAQRTVTIHWKTTPPSNLATPQILEILERQERVWHCELKGTVPDFLRWLPEQDIADLSIEQPDLDNLFRRFYRDEESNL